MTPFWACLFFFFKHYLFALSLDVAHRGRVVQSGILEETLLNDLLSWGFLHSAIGLPQNSKAILHFVNTASLYCITCQVYNPRQMCNRSGLQELLTQKPVHKSSSLTGQKTEETFHQSRYIDGKYTHEKLFNIISH